MFSRIFVSVILLFLSILGEGERDLTFCLITDLLLKVNDKEDQLIQGFWNNGENFGKDYGF